MEAASVSPIPRTHSNPTPVCIPGQFVPVVHFLLPGHLERSHFSFYNRDFSRSQLFPSLLAAARVLEIVLCPFDKLPSFTEAFDLTPSISLLQQSELAANARQILLIFGSQYPGC